MRNVSLRCVARGLLSYPFFVAFVAFCSILRRRTLIKGGDRVGGVTRMVFPGPNR